MKEIIIIYLPYILSFLTIYMTFILGNKSKKGWLIGLLNQILWLTWILISKNYGLIFMNLALFFMYYRNYRKWD